MTVGDQTERSPNSDHAGTMSQTAKQFQTKNNSVKFTPTSKIKVAKPLTISTYNVRTLYQKGKFNQLTTGCSEQNIDIVGIQEHCLITDKAIDQEWSTDGEWLFAYASASWERQGGVGMLLTKGLGKHLRTVKKVSDRIIEAHLEGNPALSIVIGNAPTEGSDIDDKTNFYNQLQDAKENIPTHNTIVLVGDFNARIGQDSHTANPRVIGKFTYHDQRNENGELLNAAAKVKKADGTRIENTQQLLSEWQQYFSKLLNNKSDNADIDPPPAQSDLPINSGRFTKGETEKAIEQMKTGKSPGCDASITADALKYGGEPMAEVLHQVCDAVFVCRIPPSQWITNIILPLPKKGNLYEMTNYRGITLMLIAA